MSRAGDFTESVRALLQKLGLADTQEATEVGITYATVAYLLAGT